MAIRVVHDKDKIRKAVRRYMDGEQVVSLAKEFKVSVPGLYLWIKKAKEEAANEARRKEMGEPGYTKELEITRNMTMDQLRAENNRLKKTLFNLLLETGKL